jgi:hypothetical protein
VAITKDAKTRTFAVAKMVVENINTDPWGEPQYTLAEYMGMFVVTEHGAVLGKGLTYEVAIADFESNVNPRWSI